MESKYEYASSNNINYSNGVLLLIQKEEFKRLVQNDTLLEKENLLFLISSIKRERDNNFFNYSFSINFIIVAVTIYFSAFLGGLGGFTDSKLEIYTQSFEIILRIGLVLCVVIFLIDKFIIKEAFARKSKSKNRLVRILENIYLEKYAS